MIGARSILATAMLCLTASVADAAGLGGFGKKGKSEAQLKRLIETLRTDPDESKRRAAIADLHDADPRAHPDVISALIASLQKDGSATVRGDAAAAIGHYHHVFPLAGMALEAAAELDASPAVRASAQQALWEYHLVGYRSLRGADGIAGQSKEPPIARPAALQPPVLPATAVSPAIPQPMPERPVRPLPAPGPSLPPIAAQPPSMARALAKAVFTPRRPLLGPLAMLRHADAASSQGQSSRAARSAAVDADAGTAAGEAARFAHCPGAVARRLCQRPRVRPEPAAGERTAGAIQRHNSWRIRDGFDVVRSHVSLRTVASWSAGAQAAIGKGPSHPFGLRQRFLE